MAGTGKLNAFYSFRKDEAAFYLNELAKGLLKNRVTVPVDDCARLMATFEAIRLEMKVLEREARCEVDIRLSWSKPVPDVTVGTGGRDRGAELERATVRKME